MLPVAIISLVLGVFAATYTTAFGTGAAVFATGFFLIALIALLSNWRGHPAV